MACALSMGVNGVKGYPVHLAKGSYLNMKITTPEDLKIAETLAEQLL